MQLRRLLTISLVIPTLALASCTTTVPPEIVTVTQEIKVPIKPRPRPADLVDPGKFYVVTEANLDEFVERFKRENGRLVFYAMTVRGYESMALNLAELRRFMKQQSDLILYYENSLQN